MTENMEFVTHFFSPLMHEICVNRLPFFKLSIFDCPPERKCFKILSGKSCQRLDAAGLDLILLR